jgi:hypothetical protein
MRARTKVDKCIDLLEEIINDQYFNPALIANIITTTYPPATQERLITLMKYVYSYHKKEMELDKKTRTGAYRINTNPLPEKTDTSWIHDNYYGEPANMNVQRVSMF